MEGAVGLPDEPTPRPEDEAAMTGGTRAGRKPRLTEQPVNQAAGDRSQTNMTVATLLGAAATVCRREFKRLR